MVEEIVKQIRRSERRWGHVDDKDLYESMDDKLNELAAIGSRGGSLRLIFLLKDMTDIVSELRERHIDY